MQYERNCPKCKCVITYKSKYRCGYAERDGVHCKKCMSAGKPQSDIYGDRYDEIIRKRSESLKKVNHWWHDKIAESRKKRGTHRLSEEHKKKISQNTIFSKKDDEHVRIKKILKEYNITYDEYLDRLGDFGRYKREVIILTRRVDTSILPNSDKRGRAGMNGAYHLDHIIEISEGYIRGINPEELAEIENLQFIPWEQNMKKRKYPNGIHDKGVKKYYGKS
jgi:hypothetical protein